MQRLFGMLTIVLTALAWSASVAVAERVVIVNGQRLTLTQIRALEHRSCGPIPNGAYWLNTQTGLWGYAGNPRPQGHLTDRCGRDARRPSLSERGLLYSPGEILRGRP